MSDINELGLPPDEVIDIDYNAPEPGQFPPSLKPGVFTFVFKLEEDPWDTVEIADPNTGLPRKYLQVSHQATTEVQEPVLGSPGETEPHEVTLRFQRVNYYKHPKMNNSSLGDLIRALDIRFAQPPTHQQIASELESISERKSYRAEVGWRVYCKADEVEVSTHPRKKRVKAGEQFPWPKGKDGKLLEMCECPKCHSKMYGNAEIMRYKLPEAVAQGGMGEAGFNSSNVSSGNGGGINVGNSAGNQPGIDLSGSSHEPETQQTGSHSTVLTGAVDPADKVA